MKLTKIFAGMAAAAIATSAMAMTAFAADAGKGPNNDDGVSVFGVYIGMTKDELENNLGVIANSGSFKFKNDNTAFFRKTARSLMTGQQFLLR